MLDAQMAKQTTGKGKKKAVYVEPLSEGVGHANSSHLLRLLADRDNRRRKTEKEEDEELLKEGNVEEDEGMMVFEESPPC